MRIRVLYFQNLKKVTGSAEEPVDVSEGTTVGDLAAILADRHPALAPHLPSVLFAVNEEHALRDHRLVEGDTLAVMPPFSGG